MPINYARNLDQVVSSHLGSLQPSKKNCFKLTFVDLPKIINAIKHNTIDPKLGYFLEQFKSWWDYAPIEVNFTPPSLSLEIKEKHRQNVNIKYATWVTVGDANLTINNFTRLHLYKFFVEWFNAVGGISRDVGNRDMVGEPNFISRVSVFDYKTKAIVQQFSNHDNHLEAQWTLLGVFPKSVTPEAYDNTDDGSINTSSVSFSVDYAFADVADISEI